MVRRHFFLFFALLIGFLAISPAYGQVRVAALQDRLEKDLRARLPRDFAVIELVMTRYRNKQLSRELIEKAYLRTKRSVPKNKNRIIYFEQTLRSLAAKARTPIPALPANFNAGDQIPTIPEDQQPGFVANVLASLRRTLGRFSLLPF